MLESALAGIIRYYEWKTTGKPVPVNHLSNFMPAIELVEEWMEKDEVTRKTDN